MSVEYFFLAYVNCGLISFFLLTLVYGCLFTRQNTDLDETSDWAVSSLEEPAFPKQGPKGSPMTRQSLDSSSTSVWGTSTGKGQKSGKGRLIPYIYIYIYIYCEHVQILLHLCGLAVLLFIFS